MTYLFRERILNRSTSRLLLQIERSYGPIHSGTVDNIVLDGSASSPLNERLQIQP